MKRFLMVAVGLFCWNLNALAETPPDTSKCLATLDLTGDARYFLYHGKDSWASEAKISCADGQGTYSQTVFVRFTSQSTQALGVGSFSRLPVVLKIEFPSLVFNPILETDVVGEWCEGHIVWFPTNGQLKTWSYLSLSSQLVGIGVSSDRLFSGKLRIEFRP